MKITKLSIGNILSFSQLQSFYTSKINLLIGPNNQGKSNILKAISFISIIFHAYEQGDNKTLKRSINLDYLVSNLEFLKEDVDIFYDQNINNKIQFEIGLEIEDEKELNYLLVNTEKYDTTWDSHKIRNEIKFMFDLCENRKVIEITGSITSNENEEIILDITRVNFPNANSKNGYYLLFELESHKILHYGSDRLGRRVYNQAESFNIHSEQYDEILSSRIAPVLCQFLANLNKRIPNEVKVIDAVRKIEDFDRSRGEVGNISSITEDLMNLRDGMHKQRKKFQLLKKYLNNLVYHYENFTDQIEIIFPYNKNSKTHTLKINIGDKTILPLSQLGSGIEQLLFLITKILNQKEGSIIMIEEPEVHLHPKLQRSFIRFLQNDLKDFNYQFFITSHSSVLIDSLLNDTSSQIFQVSNVNNFNKITNISNSDSCIDLLLELGIRGSDLLLTNGILWLEGPSDRVYIKKWLDLFCIAHSIPPLIEGRDYSILFYGGSILSNFSVGEIVNKDELDNEELDFINLLRINKNIIVVMDKDIEEGTKWESKQRIKNEVINYQHGFTWITEGKEIENYLTKGNLDKTFPDNVKKSYELNAKDKSFKEWLNKPSVYSNSKKEFAEKICNLMTIEDIELNPVLYEKIKEVYSTISDWSI